MPGPFTNHAKVARRRSRPNVAPLSGGRPCARLCDLWCSSHPNATERYRTISRFVRFRPRCTNDLQRHPVKSFDFSGRAFMIVADEVTSLTLKKSAVAIVAHLPPAPLSLTPNFSWVNPDACEQPNGFNRLKIHPHSDSRACGEHHSCRSHRAN